MGLRVVESACSFNEDRSYGTIVVESDIGAPDFNLAIEELQSTAARNLALSFAARQGVSDPRLNGTPPGTYPVNGEDVSLDEVKDEKGQALPPAHPRMQIARYRIDVLVCKRLV